MTSPFSAHPRTPPPDPHQISVRERGRRGLSPSINSGDTRHFSAVIRARFPTLYLDHLRGCAHEMQTHSILGDVETKGEIASVREVAVGRLPWKTATVQVAGSWNSKPVRLCQGATWPLFTSPGRSPGCRRGETWVTGSDTARGWEEDVTLPSRGFSKGPSFSHLHWFLSPCHFLSQNSTVAPSCFYWEQKSTSTLNHTCRVSYWASHSFPLLI